jgi:hypothetical protein
VGINHLINRIITYPIPASRKEKEICISQQIINANGYQHLNVAKMVKDKMSKNEINSVANIRKEYMVNNKKWMSFTYIGKEVMPIAKSIKKV